MLDQNRVGLNLSIVFSFRNEQHNLEELVMRVIKSIKQIDLININKQKLTYELIFVDDCSTDKSVEILSKLQIDHPITIIKMARRFGVSPCVIAGFSHAKGEAIIYMDSDLQDPPELIPALYEEFCKGAEVVHTHRIKRLGEPRYKLFLTKMAYKLINTFSSVNLPENVGDFKLLSSRVVSEILKIGDYEPYIRGLSIWVGFKQSTVDYVRHARNSGSSSFPIFKSSGPIKEFVNGLVSHSNLLLYAPIVIGFLSVFTSLVIFIFAISIKLMGKSASGIPSTLILISFYGGLMLVSNGIIGIYIGRIFNQTRMYPRYVIESIIEPRI
jgi:polyisoprenyl-phosphate glycosyltransferase